MRKRRKSNHQLKIAQEEIKDSLGIDYNFISLAGQLKETAYLYHLMTNEKDSIWSKTEKKQTSFSDHRPHW